MLKILKITQDLYVILVEGHKPMTGNLTKTMITLAALNIDMEEIEAGLMDLESNETEIAYYGVNGRFIYSAKKQSA